LAVHNFQEQIRISERIKNDPFLKEAEAIRNGDWSSVLRRRKEKKVPLLPGLRRMGMGGQEQKEEATEKEEKEKEERPAKKMRLVEYSDSDDE